MLFDSFADFRMIGQVAIVTGGAQNIGEAIARTFSGAGADVVNADLDGGKAAQAAVRISAQTGGRVLGVGCDLTDEAAIEATVAATVEDFGAISSAAPCPRCSRRLSPAREAL